MSCGVVAQDLSSFVKGVNHRDNNFFLTRFLKTRKCAKEVRGGTICDSACFGILVIENFLVRNPTINFSGLII